ncbi:MAG: outer membrane lipoprotein-sorting protein [Bacteroidales bacterium]|jgi:outer membrane lipoprotein-sorting protein|nr:outer membrane lipoprotein-sorting protein [Bacteroidales bacterium]
MKSIKLITSSFFIIVITTLSSFAQNPKEISRKSADAIALGSMEMTTTLKIMDAKGSSRSRTLNMASRKFGDITKMMMKFTDPADVKGTSILIYDYDDRADEMWIYMPALKKTRRVVSNEKGKNFMGSEFTNADMSKPNIEDFNYKIISSENLNGKACHVIEATPASSESLQSNGFSKKISYIDKENFLCYKIEYYDLKGKLLKTQTIGDYRPVEGGNYFYYEMEMKNEQNGRRSLLKTDKFKAQSQISEAQFSPSNLDK